VRTLDLVHNRKIWYTISIVAIVPGLISLMLFGLKLGIDFKGGAVLEVNAKNVDVSVVTAQGSELGFKDITVTPSGSGTLIRFRDDAAAQKQETNHQAYKAKLAEKGYKEISYSVVGPSVSKDISRNALFSILVASLAIVIYIAWAFRNVPLPMTSWNFGVAAIVALLHDSLLLIGTFSLLGHFFGIEVDALFVTAVLTVIGFSVHDTIVVFDRIRENLRSKRGSFDEIVNNSILETLARSLNTSLTVLLTLLSLFLFGGASIKTFVLALLIGIVSGTYSSIFNASQLLVSWEHYKEKHPKK
jgi:preprotein translocase subunit SecF